MATSYSYRHILAIDPSLTCSGWAVFRLRDEKLLGVGEIKSADCKRGLSYRLKDLQDKVFRMLQLLKLGNNDVLICEAPTTVLDPSASIKVEQVRSLFEVLARSFGMEVPGRINPRSVQRELMGFGGSQQKREEVKQTACDTVKFLFAKDLQALGFAVTPGNLMKHQDIVDAILIGKLAVSRVLAARAAKLPLGEYLEVLGCSKRARAS